MRLCISTICLSRELRTAWILTWYSLPIRKTRRPRILVLNTVSLYLICPWSVFARICYDLAKELGARIQLSHASVVKRATVSCGEYVRCFSPRSAPDLFLKLCRFDFLTHRFIPRKIARVSRMQWMLPNPDPTVMTPSSSSNLEPNDSRYDSCEVGSLYCAVMCVNEEQC
jgi:hypothetical protein